VIIGYGLPKLEKRRTMTAVRKLCGPSLILELYPHGTTPADGDADDVFPSANEPEPLLTKVKEILAKKRKKRQAAS